VSLFGGRSGKQDERGNRAARSAAVGSRDTGARIGSSQGGVGVEPPRTRERERGERDVASLGKSVVFSGDLSGDEDLEIEGQVEGQIQLPNHELTIGAHGRVKAQIDAKAVTVLGHIHGNINATERCEVQGSGIVVGDICAPRLLVHEGAVVNGKIEMGSPSNGASDAETEIAHAHSRPDGATPAGPQGRLARRGSR
jgi:cytoskeletal protein CcmA (bactofilin family)